MHEMKVGLIGYGMAGRVFHAPVIAAVPGLRLAKVVERRGQTSRERYPWVEVVREAAALFEDEAIELVVVATPNSSHVDLARQALLAHKHVVVDKPFTFTAAQAQELIDLARQQN
jgi:predicted dehydrogenase